jgi:hypothetical protein
MADAVENVSYRDLITKAYIDPIKSVLAIDDEYQSLDRMLEDLAAGREITANAQLARQIKTLNMARENKWIADMHDGQYDRDPAIYERLNQCDLLLLDYHLDATSPTDSSQALNILAELNRNSHFNLVVIYTRAELNGVRREVFTKLSSPNSLVNLDQGGIAELIDSLEKEGDFDLESLAEAVSRNSLAEYLMKIQYLTEGPELEGFLSEYSGILESVPADKHKNVFHLAIEQSINKFIANGDFTGSSHALTNQDGAKSVWIKTNKLFIAVVSKNDVDPSVLKDELLHAIEDWSPTCHRLLLSKIKHELDDNGQSFEDELLSCGYTNAGWLQQFFQNQDGVELTVSRLMDGLTQSLKQSVELNNYSSDLRSYIQNNGLDQVILRESKGLGDIHTAQGKVSINKKLNAYIGTKRVEGMHLMTGHVIKWEKKGVEPELLLCLTPACDLVPDRIDDRGWKTDIAPYLPVITIRLHKVPANDEKKVLKDITSKPIVVLQVNGNTEVFWAAKDKKSVFHEQVFAKDQGSILQSKSTRYVHIHRTVLEEQKAAEGEQITGVEPEGTGIAKVKNLLTVSQQCEVVAQLRYEYALNLLQRLGQDLTRIGLDFVGFRN